VAQARGHALSIVRACHGLFTGQAIGHMWRKSRFLSPYLRNTLWERGYAIDTLETALPWKNVLPAAEALHSALSNALAQFDERSIVLTHLSHIYTDGASIYLTYIFRRAPDPDETLARWTTLKTSASRVILKQGGTISHQHGVGRDHVPYLHAEKGDLGLALIRKMAKTLDPAGMMNPGKLVED
jgi:alkyldihydroxyacetonephosphate synthase